MTNVNNVSKVLKSIHHVAEDVIIRTGKLKRAIENDDDGLIYDLQEEYSSEDEERVMDVISDVIISFYKDAKTVLGQIDSFSECVMKESLFEKNVSKYPFLHQVWTGDVYGPAEVEGLRELLKDLQSQSKIITMEEVLNRTKEELNE